MKHVFFVLLFFLTVNFSFAQFSDTSTLNAYIRDTIRDRRPDKVTAAQLQKGLLGIVKFIPINTPLNSMQVGYGSSTNTLKGNSTFTFNDITNTLYADTFTTKRLNVINSPGGTEYTRINYNTLNIVHNAGSDNVINLTTNNNSFKRITVTNANPGVSAGAGSLYINDLGYALQYYVGSSTNAFVPNGTLFRTNAPGGFNIVADAGPIAFGKSAYMGAAEFARFLNNGNFGIGTSTPGKKLQVNGSGLFADTLTAQNTMSVTGNINVNQGVINMTTTGISGHINITANQDGWPRMVITNAANTANAGAGVLFTNDAGYSFQQYMGSSINGFVPGGALIRTTGPGGFNIVADAGPIAFGKNATIGASEFARFTTNGWLGIGTQTPLQKLHVAGQVKIDTITTGSSTDSVLTTSNGLIQKVAASALNAYTFSTGLTNTSGTITANLSTGVAGGQTVVGGTASGNNLTLSSTTDATKGKLLFGTSAYDEVNNTLGLGLTTPSASLHLKAGTATAGTAPLKLTSGTLLTTPEAGAIEYNGTGYYFTDATGVRRNLTQTDRVFKIYPWDYNADTLDFEMYGWNAQYVSDPTYAPSILATIDVEITVTSGTPAGTIISAIFEGQTVYKLTVTGTAATDYYVIGSIKVSQDIKYPYIYYIKGAAETIDGTGLVSTVNTAYRFNSDSFINPMIEFGTNSSSLARIGCTYTVDKKQQGRWIYNHGPGGGAGTF